MINPQAKSDHHSYSLPTLGNPPVGGCTTSPKNIFAKRPWLSYTVPLLPLIIAASSFVLYYILNRRHLYMSSAITERILSNPRQAAQVVALLGSCFSGIVRWGLSGAFALMAQKRFRSLRSVFEVEVWTSLKNGGVVWSYKLRWRRVIATTMTVLMMVLCGLMTSGFVSLLSPLPLMVEKQITGDSELDLSSTLPQCVSWFEQRRREWMSANADVYYLDYKGYKFQESDVKGALTEVLEAGRASMLTHIMDSVSSTSPHTFISTLARLENTRILGSTAGVIPMGPGGIGAFAVHGLDSDPSKPVTDSRLDGKYDYTIRQQGFILNISCEYTDKSSLPYQWVEPTVETTINIHCPPPIGSYNFTFPPTAQLFTVYCVDPSTHSYTYYLQSMIKELAVPDTPTLAYAGIGLMRCELSHYIGDVVSRYDANLSAFKMTPAFDISVPSERTEVTSRVYTSTHVTLQNAQTYRSGNLVGSLINSLAVALYNLPLDQRHEKYPALIASLIKGIFEYQATHLRLLLETSSLRTPAPDECRRPVTGTVVYPVLGWEAQRSTLLALLPLGLIGLTATAFAIAALTSKHALTLFDPTHPVSLIAAASAGGMRFDSDTVGDPGDEVVRTTRVVYGCLPSASSSIKQETRQCLAQLKRSLPDHIVRTIVRNPDQATAEEVLHAVLRQAEDKWGLLADNQEAHTSGSC